MQGMQRMTANLPAPLDRCMTPELNGAMTTTDTAPTSTRPPPTPRSRSMRLTLATCDCGAALQGPDINGEWSTGRCADMGYLSIYDTDDAHEGWVRMAYADGNVSSGTSTGAGHYIEGYTYLPADDNDTRTWGQIDPAFLRPDSEIAGWQPVCECGWTGIVADVPEAYADQTFREPSDQDEHLLMGQWRLHIRDVFPGAYAEVGQTVDA